MSNTLPVEMRAVVLSGEHGDLTEALRSLRVGLRTVPQPRRGQVVVRIEGAPCNPSDLALIQGRYGIKKALPAVPGLEGAGTVVASGGGAFARWLVGKRVACGGQADRDGTWAEYYLAEARTCVPLRRNLSFEQGATLIVNPLTALILFDLAGRGGHRAAVQTAGASQVGRMLVRLAAKARYPLISVVRSASQAERLHSLDATIVLDSTADDFEARLRSECQRLKATIAFDAVAGPMSRILMNAMPRSSTLVIYGGLSGQEISRIDPRAFIFEGKRVEGFWLPRWVSTAGFLHLARLTNRAQALIADGTLRTEVHRRVRLEEVPEALIDYHTRMTDGKVLILPGAASP
jgi:NADPH2:quinone reductase